MPEEALHSLYFEAAGFNNDILQIWLTITFAAIIALYIASPHLTRFLRVLITGLYSTSALVLFGRLLYSLLQITHYRTKTIELGYDEIPRLPLNELLGLSYVGLFVIGSLATIWFLATYSREEAT